MSADSPLVKKFFLEIPPPSLKDNTGEIDRLRKQLKLELGAEPFIGPLSQVSRWASVLKEADYQVSAAVAMTPPYFRIIDIEPGRSLRNLGLAVDLGTTQIAYQLWDLDQGRPVAETSSQNPQVCFGADILTRILQAEDPGKRKELQSVVVSEINRILAQLCHRHGLSPGQVYALTLAGNTTMVHLFLGLDPASICREPYIPVINRVDDLQASELGLEMHPNGPVYIFPNVGSYLGGDILSGILASDLHRQEYLSMMVDVGTNAEVVFGNSQWLIGCAGAAGPALESGVAQMGVVAQEGAIDQIRIDPKSKELTYSVIGRRVPIGVCGSGLIDLAAQMFLAGLLDIQGKFNLKIKSDRWLEMDGQPAYLLAGADESATGEPIFVTQVDMDILLRSKAAMYTILTTLVNSVGYSLNDVERFYIAGTFGNHIDPVMAITLGLIPDLPLERYIPIGNASLKGAAKVLLDSGLRSQVLEIAGKITYVEMNVNQDFMNRFSAARFIPHTDRSLFPSVQGPF